LLGLRKIHSFACICGVIAAATPGTSAVQIGAAAMRLRRIERRARSVTRSALAHRRWANLAGRDSHGGYHVGSAQRMS
jgi:hypothetical protein